MKRKADIQIRRILDGHTEEFAQLIRQNGDRLMAFVGRIVGRQEDAEDVVQDAFVTAFERLADYDADKASFATWLQRIAYYTALHHLRQRPVVWLEENDVALADTPDELPDKATAEQLDNAIQQLPPEDQMLLHLYYFDEQPLKEIAYILGAKDIDREASRLSTRLQRIRQRLRLILNSMNDE